MLHSGASLTATDMESYTPLMLAAAAGHTDAFNILLARGSAIDDVDNDGQTVLHLAAKENHTKVLQVMHTRELYVARILNVVRSTNCIETELALLL